MSIQTQKSIKQKTKVESKKVSKPEQKITPVGLMEIGRPIGIRPNLDYNNILKNKILSKMSIIDLVPVDAGLMFLKAGDALKKLDTSAIVSSMLPKVTYNDAIERFARTCQLYGLPPYSGIRLYIVDESTVVDEIKNEFSENALQRLANSISDKFRNYYEIARSLSTQYDVTIDKLVSDAENTARNTPVLSSIMEKISQSKAGGTALQVAETISKIVAKGTRISIPRKWSDSSYSSQSSCVVKLVSPYGSPKAILNYIAKPLLALLLISSAVSEDGVSYGYPRILSVNAYGLGKVLLGAIDSISIRRGGADTSFNRYRQPLSVDISITFAGMISGYGALCPSDFKKQPKEHNVLNRFTKFVQDTTTWAGNLSILNTPGKIIDSLRPVNLVNYKSQMNKGFLSIDKPVSIQQPDETGHVSVNRSQDNTSAASATAKSDVMKSKYTGTPVDSPSDLGVA